MNINEIQKEIHKNAIAKGWHEEKRTFGDIIALCHSELSEALEEHRNGRAPRHIYYNEDKPEGIPIELADVVIRIMDLCESEGVSLAEAIEIKHKYNLTRPYRHGGKRL